MGHVASLRSARPEHKDKDSLQLHPNA
jgi:hypothetical protein